MGIRMNQSKWTTKGFEHCENMVVDSIFFGGGHEQGAYDWYNCTSKRYQREEDCFALSRCSFILTQTYLNLSQIGNHWAACR